LDGIHQTKPAFDAVETFVEAVHANAQFGILDAKRGDGFLDMAEAQDDLVEFVFDAVEPIMDAGELSPHEVNDISVGHGRLYPIQAVKKKR
jgi:hypothetical protein